MQKIYFVCERLMRALSLQRRLIDYFDKQLSIMLAEDFRYFPRRRQRRREQTRSLENILRVREDIRRHIKHNGPVSSQELDMGEKVDWYWSDTRLSRAALEAMYFWGELAISFKAGTNKYYDLIENCFDSHVYEDDYMESNEAFHKWLLLRRIKSVGILWNKPSDAFLGMDGSKSEIRNTTFAALQSEERIQAVTVRGLKDTFYIVSEDKEKLQEIVGGLNPKKRCSFIAPLDNMMWDRKLIEQLFGFNYRWEIYTPEVKRKYGYYVLPVIYGYNFAGRVEMLKNKVTAKMEIKNFWPEENFKVTKAFEKDFYKTAERFAKFNGMEFSKNC